MLMSDSIVLAVSAAESLEPAPITPDWVLGGTPAAQSKILAKSRDGTSYIMVWECSAGSFRWQYDEDETLTVISGEVFITDDLGRKQRLGEGDMGFFPAGSSCTWYVPDRIKKIAVLRKDLPFPVGFGVRAFHKLLRAFGFRGSSPLISATSSS
jgi:uncharacterized protein